MGKRAAKAIDLYSGIGGWTLGLKLSGIELLASYEWWPEANATHHMNFGSKHPETDIRALSPREIPHPESIRFIVGSPPCTQFSFANRGGKGDLADGLKDIEKFLSIVAHVKPRYWAMENVPRVAQVLEEETRAGKALFRFRPLIKHVNVYDLSDFGVPQARRRMIAGDFPAELLEQYKGLLPRRTLGDVIQALSRDPVTDPIYGYSLPKSKLTDHAHEPCLSEEESRMNREAKTFHPIYNKMAFPDELGRPCRTITATCTRISRESVVIPAGKQFRRLTPRERASVQAFPITFQFYGKSYASRIKMIGNAFPPLMAYFVGAAMLEKTPAQAARLASLPYRHPMPAALPPAVRLDTAARAFPPDRSFCAAIPGLRFGSGVRFDLANAFEDRVVFRARFFCGNSKNIIQIPLDAACFRSFHGKLPQKIARELLKALEELDSLAHGRRFEAVQQTWTRRSEVLHPYTLVDALGVLVARVATTLSKGVGEAWCRECVRAYLVSKKASARGEKDKLVVQAPAVCAGFMVCSYFNAFAAKRM